MGFAFKENCIDIRNTGVINIVKCLKNKKCSVHVYDPIVDNNECIKEYNLKLIDFPYHRKYDSVIIAVSHKIFKIMGIKEIKKFGKKNCLIFDLKALFSKKEIDISL